MEYFKIPDFYFLLTRIQETIQKIPMNQNKDAQNKKKSVNIRLNLNFSKKTNSFLFSLYINNYDTDRYSGHNALIFI